MSLRIAHRLSIGLLVGLFIASNASAQRPNSGPVTTRYSEAVALVRAHEWDLGIAALQPILDQNTSDLKVLNLAGLAYTGKGDLEKADHYFKTALRVRPSFLPALKNLGINEFTLHDFASSIKHLAAALKQSPDDPVINVFLGQIAYNQGHFKAASGSFRLAGGFVSRDPNLKAQFGISLMKSDASPTGLEMLAGLDPKELSATDAFAVGLALAQADRPDRAIAYFEDLRRRYPTSYDIGFNLLVCDVQSNRAADALAIGNSLIQAAHDTDEVESALAQAYEKSHATLNAVAALRRAIELAPKNEDNYLDFANLCISHRDLDNGLKVIGVGLSVLPNSSRLVFERGVLYAMQDRFDVAEQDFERSARLAPMTNFGYVGIGVTYLETGHAVQAAEVLRERLKKYQDDASLLYLLGEALMRTGAQPGQKEYAEAQDAFERSVKLNPGLCLPHVALGEIYVDEDRFKDAIRQLEKARSIDPKEKSAYSHLAVAYRKNGDPDSARRVLTDLKDLYQQEQGWLQNRFKTQDSSSAGPSGQDPNN